MKTQKIGTPELDAMRGCVAATSGLAFVGYDHSGRITFFDESAERLFGYRSANVAGIATHELLHDGGQLAALFEAKSPAHKAVTLVLEAQTRERERLPVEVTLHPVIDSEEGTAWVALYHDQSPIEIERHRLGKLRDDSGTCKSQSEKEAEFLRELLGRTMETIQIGLAVQELRTGMIAYLNEGFNKISGIEQREVIGSTFSQVFSDFPHARDRFVRYLEKVERSAAGGTEPPAPAIWEVELPAGKKVIEVYGRPLVLEGHPSQYLLLIMEDHTDRHRLQMQLVQSEKLAAIGQLAAGIAHELRNPLTTIFNALFDLNEILQPRTREVAEDVDICMDEIKRVQDIINNLLDFAREGERSLGKSSLNDVLDRTIRLVRHDLQSKQIEVKVELNPDIPNVAINDNAMKQILINLITNASQAMTNGGVLTVRTCKRPGPVPMTNPQNPGNVTPNDSGGSRLRLAD